MFETAQTLKRLSSIRKTPTPKQQRTDSIEQKSPPNAMLNKSQDLARQKSFLEQPGGRRMSIAPNDDANILAKATTPRGFDRTPSMHSRPLTRSNSMNPGNKEPEKLSSGERSFLNSGPQSRRVSIGMNRSPVRAEDLERLLTKVILLILFSHDDPLFVCLCVCLGGRRKLIFSLSFENQYFLFSRWLMMKLKH